MEKLNTWHIHINGQVQGIGFRPYIYRLAVKNEITGWVNNSNNGVHIQFNATVQKATQFYKEIISSPPPLTFIGSHSIKTITDKNFNEFKILSSNEVSTPSLLLTPDFAICQRCSSEINDKANRRYQYAFTTCTSCGPRYSIINKLPYDRENTSMHAFKMCQECLAEYFDQSNRRYFSQTNSCPTCPLTLQLYDNQINRLALTQEDIVFRVCELWSAGKIVALKGIGGFILTCAASDKNAIKQLRKRKHRPTKPFAVMFPDLDSINNVGYLNEDALNELKSPSAPIVLLHLKQNPSPDLDIDLIAPGLSKVGVMLPYTPLYQLALKKYGKPIIATSGNISTSPIIYENKTALNELNSIADYILIHNREIVIPQDDSVIKFSPHFNHRIILRRSRGYAPSLNKARASYPQQTILALGALLKSSFTVLHNQNLHVSQYLGNTVNYDAQQSFKKVLCHFLKLFQTSPEVVITDKHPDYYSSQLGKKIEQDFNIRLLKVQHHEAHFASVLGEHNLLDATEPILGVIWDGTGLGYDGQIWGGEFFNYYQRQFSRVHHFEYFDSFLGDKMALEPRLSAFALCHQIESAIPVLQPKFTPSEWQNYTQLIKKNSLKTSSVGRLFDAVAALLGLVDKTTYEGEAAMLVEEQASHFFKDKLTIPSAWLNAGTWQHALSGSTLIQEVLRKLYTGIAKPEIAAWFHVQLVLSVQRIAKQQHCKQIAFSGGVFQNGLLIDLLYQLLGTEYKLYFNQDLSPNDENISFGQVIWFAIHNAPSGKDTTAEERDKKTEDIISKMRS